MNENELEDPLQGHTRFHMLDVSQEPIPGAAVIWPNVQADGTLQRWTTHSGEPVYSEGTQKFSMNLWLHSVPVAEKYTKSANYCLDAPLGPLQAEQRVWKDRFMFRRLHGHKALAARPEFGANERVITSEAEAAEAAACKIPPPIISKSKETRGKIRRYTAGRQTPSASQKQNTRKNGSRKRSSRRRGSAHPQ